MPCEGMRTCWYISPGVVCVCRGGEGMRTCALALVHLPGHCVRGALHVRVRVCQSKCASPEMLVEAPKCVPTGGDL